MVLLDLELFPSAAPPLTARQVAWAGPASWRAALLVLSDASLFNAASISYNKDSDSLISKIPFPLNAEAADARSQRFELADLCEVEAAPPARARSSRYETSVWMVLLDLELFQLHLLLRLPRQQ